MEQRERGAAQCRPPPLGRSADSERERDRRALLDVLDWLWDVIAASGSHRTRPYRPARGGGCQWPRVWWCPTGPLTLLPIHAAGHHPRLGTAITER